VAALYGHIVDPRTVEDIVYPSVKMPEQFLVDDSMFVLPPENPEKVEVVRGPNIGDPPRNEELPEDLVGVAAIKVGDKITTDHIMPAGQRLKYRSNIAKYAEYVFENTDGDFPRRAGEIRDKGAHVFIIAGSSYGQGSSREHAALCPMYLGVKAVIAKSMERIHMANLINFGIVPLIFSDDADYESLTQGDELEISDIREALVLGKEIVLKNITQGQMIKLKAEFSERQRKLLLAGGLLNATAG